MILNDMAIISVSFICVGVASLFPNKPKPIYTIKDKVEQIKIIPHTPIVSKSILDKTKILDEESEEILLKLSSKK